MVTFRCSSPPHTFPGSNSLLTDSDNARSYDEKAAHEQHKVDDLVYLPEGDCLMQCHPNGNKLALVQGIGQSQELLRAHPEENHLVFHLGIQARFEGPNCGTKVEELRLGQTLNKIPCMLTTKPHILEFTLAWVNSCLDTNYRFQMRKHSLS